MTWVALRKVLAQWSLYKSNSNSSSRTASQDALQRSSGAMTISRFALTHWALMREFWLASKFGIIRPSKGVLTQGNLEKAHMVQEEAPSCC